MTLIATYICAKHMDATFIETSGQCVKCLEDEIHKLRVALLQYADRDNWDALNDGTYHDWWLGRRLGDARHGWEIAEEALK